MEFQEFLDQVVEFLPDYLLNDDIEKICVEKIVKNNGIVCKGIAICKKDDKASPNIYMDPYYSLYKEGMSLDEILKMVVQEYREAGYRIADAEIIFEPDDIKERVFLQLINYEKNKDTLSTCPHIPFLDLALTLRYIIKQDEGGIASAVLTNNEIDRLGLDEDELFDLAYDNTQKFFPSKFGHVKDIMYEMAGKVVTDDIPLYILTNKQCVNGATYFVYADLLRSIADRVKSSFYVLPASVHELLFLLDEQDGNEIYLASLVKHINSKVLPDVDFLSDNVYYYNYDTSELIVFK